jgi:regulatory protein
MPTVTALKTQKKTGRVNVFIDGRFAFALSAESLLKAELKVDREISQAEIGELIKEDDFLKVYDRVLKFLSFRPRSEKELKDWFVKKEVDEETQKLIYPKLKHLGYINDEEFAKWWIEQRMTFRPAGRRLLTLELRQKGIAQSLIAQLLNCSIAQGSELELAKKVAEKKLKRLKDLPPLEFKQKLSAILARRGFDWETINEVLSEIKSSSSQS